MNRYSSSLILLAMLGVSVAFEAGAAMEPSASASAGNTASSVALDGDTLIIGSPYNAVGNQQQAGQAYVYLRGASGWTSQGELAPVDRAAFDEFGSAVAISGDTALVGAKRKNDDKGAVYVFVRSGTSWSYQATLTNPASASGLYSFGSAVAISGDTAVVGDPATGSSYVFKRSGVTWGQPSNLVPSDGQGFSYFGCAVAISGDSALIGAPGVNTAYVFKSSGGSWASPQQTKLSNSLPGYNYLGYAVDLSGRVALLGSPGESGGGAAYIFYNNGTTWTQQARLAATGGAAGDRFGKSVNLGGEQADVALIGAPNAIPPSGGQSGGVAHLFTRQGTAWSAHPGNPLYNRLRSGSQFGVGPELGRSVSLFGDTAVAVSFFGTADIFTFECGFGRDWTPGIWMFGGLPCNPDVNTVQGQLGDDLIPANYGVTKRWIVYDWNANTSAFRTLDLNSTLAQGVGVEHKTLDSARVDFAGIATPIIQSSQCPVTAGCFEIPLTPPNAGDTAARANLVGYPFPYPVDWADARFVLLKNGVTSVYTPTDAHNANVANKSFKRYNGNAYEVYDDTTPGMNGNLWPNESIWVWTKPGAAGGSIKLLIPAKPSRQNAAAPQDANARFTLIERLFGWLIPTAEAAPQADAGAAIRDARRKQYRDAIARQEDWYIRLIVETADGQYADPANVLGQLSDAAKGYDERDLDEPPPLEGGPTLTVVFPHPDWQTAAGNYSSDYHPPSKNRGDAWNFEVRSNQRGILRLRWQASSPEALARGRLVDEETGAIIAAADTDHYEFDLTVPVRAFRWEFLPNRDKPAN